MTDIQLQATWEEILKILKIHYPREFVIIG